MSERHTPEKKLIPLSALQETFTDVHCPTCSAPLDEMLHELLDYCEEFAIECPPAAEQRPTTAPVRKVEAAAAKPFITWRPGFDLGNEVIDAHHRQIVDIINRLHVASKSPNRQAGFLNKILDELDTFAREHFTTEERLFQPLGAQILREQEIEHEQFLKTMKRFREQLQYSFLAVTPIFAFMTTWFVEHTQKFDRRLVGLLKAKKSDS